MGKGKRPHKKDSGADEEVQPQTEEKAELVPPARRPPTAVGAGTPPEPPPPQPPRPSDAAPEHRRPTLFSLLQTVRGAVGALMGWADAAADVINKTLQRRA